MSQASEARKRFMDVTLNNSSRTVENFKVILTMANEIVKAEACGFVIDPDSVEKAVKNVLGVN